MATQELIYTDRQQTTLRGVLATPEKTGEKVPGILVVHEAFGIGSHTIDRARQLSELGYVALAVDMFGDGRTAGDLQGGMALVGEIASDPTRLRDRIASALTALRQCEQVDASRTGAIGFCFGGTTVLELARSGADVKGVVSFHGTLTPMAPVSEKILASILVCHGDADPFVPDDQIEAFRTEMRAAGIDWQLDIHGGAKHGFTNPEADSRGIDGLAYDERTDRRSWDAMKSFFDTLFVR